MNLEQVKQSTSAMKLARSVKSTQTRIERMQLAIARKTKAIDSKVAQGLRELKLIAKRKADAIKLGVTFVSNFAPLLTIYNDSLATIKEKDFKAQYKEKATKMKLLLSDTDLKAQGKIIDTYFALQAKYSMQEVHNIRAFLTGQGLLEGATLSQAEAQPAEVNADAVPA